MNQCHVDFDFASIEVMLAIGGWNDNGAFSSVETYSNMTGSWSYMASLPSFVYGHHLQKLHIHLGGPRIPCQPPL